ncbi:Anaphase-promoting complex, subunit 10/DOC domain protein [Kalmanozyma brasiliensis GHG001]|uniref:DOC domain-containing protein n=1 Tax=Kalmanozyma brasiliensis (strain GHG001) TaxID=1365824 RepID=V5EU35_KALBG|nr:Anaphase-promoting complex, subunit 10/DOC domain protein [Kalmanozyma brasiliensis GHG001]EST06613.1 Anaphase-promoting complex, subunit 10/DOC domain protein [Kalmanozyma brasiliensis GHG001]
MQQNAEASTSRGAAQSPPTADTKPKRSRRIYDVDDRTTKTDVGSSPGTQWTLSSYKPGSGVSELRSPDLTKLWQSDGNQPHLINIQFARRTCVTHLSIYLDVKQDDSYTPTKIAVRAGTNYHDLTLVRQRTFDTPQGWKHFSMTIGSVDASVNEEDEDGQEGEEAKGEDGEDEDEEDGGDGIRVWLIQVCILANHLNGKDTHIRRLVVFGPKTNGAPAGGDAGTKRAPTNGLTYAMPPTKTRTALSSSGNGQDVTLAQLLSIQSAAREGEAAQGEDEEGAIGGPARRSALNLFGNIR